MTMKSFSFFKLIIISSFLWKPSAPRKDRDCIHLCGYIEIPYPFGIGPDHCSLNSDFAVSCNSSSSSHTPFLKNLNLEILEVRKSSNEIIVKIPSVTACNGTEIHWSSPTSLYQSSFYLQDSNVFASVGCHGYAFLFDDLRGISGCTSVCATDHRDALSTSPADTMVQCYGFNHCCQFDVDILWEYNISVSAKNGSGQCRTAFLISREYLANFSSTASTTMSAVPVMLYWNPDDSRIVVDRVITYLILPIVVPITLACYCVGQCWWNKTKKRRYETKLRKKYFKGKLEEQSLYHEEAEKTKLFTEEELKKATDNFNENRIIGKGGQGTVFKGMLSDGELIAVKRSTSLSEGQWKEFINEVIILSHINHRNVVKLLGCCLETKSLHLVYEFIPNGTLCELIHCPNEDFRVTWDIRLRVVSEVAGAIAYLHSSSTTPIYHRDIKTSNILLDHKYTAKVCDFGISRSTSMNQTHLTTCIRGTFGYLDPQYFRSRQFSEKSDVYSFGVVLVEILTGQKPTHVTSENSVGVVMQFVEFTNRSSLYEMLDPIVLECINSIEDIMVVVDLAKRCLHSEGARRPTMMQVALELANLSQKCSAQIFASLRDTEGPSQEFFSAKTHLDEPGSF